MEEEKEVEEVQKKEAKKEGLEEKQQTVTQAGSAEGDAMEEEVFEWAA